MKLVDQLAAFASLLEARTDEATARAVLFGERAECADAQRLSIYARFCRIHRAEALEGVYPHVRNAVERRFGPEVWHELYEAYFRAHPMHHVEINENGASFSTWLATRSELPVWLPALAEVEWWEWMAFIAPDEEQSSTQVRLAQSVEVRPIGWAFDPWLASGAEGAPEQREQLVVFWRDRDLDARHGDASHLELIVMKAASEGTTAAPEGVDAQAFAETLEDLQKAGIVLP